jgi:chemotaxis protein MotB
MTHAPAMGGNLACAGVPLGIPMRYLPWLLLAVATGIAGSTYFHGYRPLVAERHRLHGDLATLRANRVVTQAELSTARIDLQRARAELEKCGAEAKVMNDELQRTSESSELHEQLLAKLRADLKGSGIEVTSLGGRITLTMLDTILFKTGEADLTTDGEAVLRRLEGALKAAGDKTIQVNGYTDNVPITTELRLLYPTNWELSASRAINVVRFLNEKLHIAPQRLMPVGYGPHRPVASNATAKGRAQNRRIEILLLPARLQTVTADAAKNDAPKADGKAMKEKDRAKGVAAENKKRPKN